jgi:hypothetical protein
MAGDVFELLVSYPDGHIEIIEENFYNLEKAREYGEGMMSEIAATEQFHQGRDDGSLTPRRLRKPYYEIYKIVDGDREFIEKGKGKKIK